MKQVKVLFVCMGNICRSPTAHALFRQLVEDEGLEQAIKIDSAGTHAYHVGEAPDRRSAAKALSMGIDMSDLRARQAVPEDFYEFDYVLAMDADNYANLQAICPAGYESRLGMFLDFAKEYSTNEVPDPYYGGASGFDHVFDLVDSGSRGLLEDIREKHL